MSIVFCREDNPKGLFLQDREHSQFFFGNTGDPDKGTIAKVRVYQPMVNIKFSSIG